MERVQKARQERRGEQGWLRRNDEDDVWSNSSSFASLCCMQVEDIPALLYFLLTDLESRHMAPLGGTLRRQLKSIRKNTSP